MEKGKSRTVCPSWVDLTLRADWMKQRIGSLCTVCVTVRCNYIRIHVHAFVDTNYYNSTYSTLIPISFLQTFMKILIDKFAFLRSIVTLILPFNSA
jgi:hypothetical protein